MYPINQTFRKFLQHQNLLLSLVFISAACSPKLNQTDLPLNPPDSFSINGNTDVAARWWSSFNDPKLNYIVEEALDSNFNILAAWQRLQVAEAFVDIQSSQLLPSLEARAQAGMSRPEPDFVGGENSQLGLSAFYEADLWGRLRSSVEAEQYRAEASYYDLKAAALSIAAEITTTYYQLHTSWSQLRLLEEQIETNEQILELIRARFGSGMVRGVDILRQEQLLQSTLEQKIMVEADIAILEHRLAVLSGETPDVGIEYVPAELPELPPVPATGLPAELITRRPDVLRDFNFLLSADRELASAISSRYPRFTIRTSLQSRANNFTGLFQDWAYSLAGNLVAPLFYGGRLSAEVDRAEAFKQQRLYEYGQTILIAFQEVEDALVQEHKQALQLEVIQKQVELAEKTYKQLQMEYFNGMTDYLAVLTALIQEQQLRRDLITARYDLIQFRISLYRALAGGFVLDIEEENRS